MQVTLLVPVYNEPPLVLDFRHPRLRKVVSECLVIDDGSDPPYRLLHAPSKVEVRRLPTHRGYGAALKQGVAWALTDWIVTMDGDGQHELEDVLRLIQFVERFGQQLRHGCASRLLSRPQGVDELVGELRGVATEPAHAATPNAAAQAEQRLSAKSWAICPQDAQAPIPWAASATARCRQRCR